jgi:transcriptional regulator with XRE-family HTH domain
MRKDNPSVIGERMRGLRRLRGWTQPELAAQLRRLLGEDREIAQETLSRIENGRTPQTWLLDALAQALDTTADYLLGYADDPAQPEELSSFPIPLPELYTLVARLNGLPGERRRQAAALMLALIEFSEAHAVVARDPEVEQLVKVLDSLPADRRTHWMAAVERAADEARHAASRAVELDDEARVVQ